MPVAVFHEGGNLGSLMLRPFDGFRRYGTGHLTPARGGSKFGRTSPAA